MNPLYIVTHAELTPGYQIAQVAHAVADLAISHPEQFTDWHTNSQYIVALQVSSATELEELFASIPSHLEAISFREPDLNDAMTSVAFVPHADNKPHLAHLSLAGRNTGNINKHNPRGLKTEGVAR